MTTTGAVYDRGYRPYEGPRGRRAAATAALYRASMRRALGLRRSWRQKVAPFVLLGIVTIPAIINVGVGYVTRERAFDRIEIVSYREYVGVLGRPAAVRRHRGAGRGVPGPAPARPPVDVRPAVDRLRLRRSQVRRHLHALVRLLVHPAGRAVRRQHARQRQRAGLLHEPSGRAVEGAGRGPPAHRLLRHHRRRHRLADRPTHRCRCRHHRPAPRHVRSRRRCCWRSPNAKANRWPR